MDYCQETVIIQSAFMLARKIINIEDNFKKHEFAEVVEIIKEAINEVSDGLSINKTKQHPLPIQIKALHRKLHLWFYKTWQKCSSCAVAGYLKGFPSLPNFGTGFYVAIVKEMSWESLFAECLFHTHEEVLPLVIQDILPILTNQPCSKEDNELVIVLLDCLLTLLQKNNRSATLVQDGLTFMCEHVIDKNLQVHLIKKIIDIVFEKCFKKNHSDIWLNELQLKGESESTGHSRPSDLIELIYYLEALIKLFKEVWKEICNWSIDAEDNAGEMDFLQWHPLHHWILKMYAVLGFIISDSKCNTSQDSRMCLFYNGVTGYVEIFATISENKWFHNLQEGVIVNWNDGELEDETIDNPGANKILIFTNESLEEQFLDAIWRVNHNLEGSVDCLNWLLTTEELFDNPLWIACVKGNVSKIYGHKEQAFMMIDILCIQRQIENVNECDSSLFDVLKGLIIDIFNDLPIMDQEEILEYGFRMSLLSALDISCDSVFLNPNHQENDRKMLQDELQIQLNKLVDSSVFGFGRQVENIKEMALLCPYITLYRVLEAGVQYGQTHTIIKIFEELSILCSLCKSDTEKPMMCEILVSIATGLRNKQEENNFIKLVKMLLKVNRNVDLQGKRQLLLDTSNLVSSCILPYMNLHGNNKLMPTKFALKLLKSIMNTFDVNNQTAKAFVLNYLIPLILSLCKLLDGCKVHFEERIPSLPLADVAELRSLSLFNIEVSINVIHNIFQSVPTILVYSVQWLNNNLKYLDWTVALYVKDLLDILPIKHQSYIPKCVIEFCNLPPEHWSAHGDYHDYNVVDGLFQCCAVSDPMSCQVIDALNKRESTSLDEVSLKDVVRNLCQVMTYFTWSEMSRVLSLCKILIQKGQLPLESFHHSKTQMLCSAGLPDTHNGILGMSRILLQVFQLLMSTGTSPSTVVLANVIKLYVSTIKEMCWELVIDPGLDKVCGDQRNVDGTRLNLITKKCVRHLRPLCPPFNSHNQLIRKKALPTQHAVFQPVINYYAVYSFQNLSGDVISHVFDDLSQVICMVAFENTDPLFILAMDVASMVSGRHAINLKQSVTMVPKSVYTELLLQKLDMQNLAP